MHAYPYAAATLALVTQWSVGIAATSAIADTEEGLIRDHPLYGRKLLTRVVTPLITIGLVAPFLIDGHLEFRPPPPWVTQSCALMLPFAFFSYLWSRAWLVRTPAWKRRRLGLISGIIGVAGMVVSAQIAISSFQPPWVATFPLMLFLGTSALLGALTTFTLLAATAELPAEVPGGPTRHVAEIGGFGLLATLLAGIDVGSGLISGGGGWTPTALILGRVWIVAGLCGPGLLLLSRRFGRRLPDSLLMGIALTFAVIGAFAGLVLVFGYPGLVGPPFPEPI